MAEEEPEDAALLASPAWPAMDLYYDQLRTSGLRVKQTQAMGKGVFADTDFEVDDVVLHEPPLLGVQHSYNKADAVVCSFCLRYIGSIPLQIKNKLQGGEYPCCEKDQKVSCLEAIEKPCVEAIELLSKENFSLPYEEQFQLPAIVKCPRGCPELFCSDSCAEAAWEAHHCLLCVGVSQNKDALIRFKQFADETNDVFHLASQLVANVMLRGKRLSKERGVDTRCRDMSVLLEAWRPFAMPHKRLWWEAMALPDDVDAIAFSHVDELLPSLFQQPCMAACIEKPVESGLIWLQAFQVHLLEERDNTLGMPLMGICCNQCIPSQQIPLSHVLEHPTSIFEVPTLAIHVNEWWEAMALPDDVDPTEEDSFRNQIKELAASSLDLLRAALYEEEYAPLFSLKVYGSIIGMFELNNLEIVVPSPVEDYFCYIDGLEHDLKQTAEEVTRPLLHALGDKYASFCEGTGFYALQSCMNHSCQPNAKAFKRDEDKDGHAVLLATRTIMKGEQILISYIDENASYSERQSMLADYGFECRCSKCSKEM